MITSNLRLLMKQKGISIRKLSADAIVAESTITKSRRSASIIDCKLRSLVRIAEALNCSVKDLFEHEFQKKQNNSNTDKKN